ncbi:MAG: UvrD-helicase domain-containing protein, partial [Acidimicrobiales bacterium]
MKAGSPSAFDLYGPLPPAGVTLIEASAGTGKTYTIAALVTRFVAEAGVPVENILAVTFTRLATAELRERVRSRMASAEESLGRVLDGGLAASEDDALVATLARTGPTELSERRRRLADALASFDAATIATTHGFCHLVLAGLGVAGDVAVGASLVENADDTIDEVVDDLYLRWALLHQKLPPFDLAAARQIARAAVGNPETVLLPEVAGTPSGLRRRFSEKARAEVRRRLLDANLLTYDDLLVRLRSALEDGSRGEIARRKLRDQYPVVLVDELQDTDPVQWKVVRSAFGSDPEPGSGPTSTLVLIGDPKQAIYTFRGGDVYAYLDAARRADWRYTLRENWRTDQGLLDALDALLQPLRLGHTEIEYRPVTAVAAHRRPGIDGAPLRAPLRLRLVPVASGLVKRTNSGPLKKDAAVEWVALDLASDVVALLTSGATLPAGSEANRPQRRPLTPSDLAVLVRTNQQAAVVQAALLASGVPAVVAGTDSVFSTAGAHNWLTLLEALEEPQSRSRAAALALTPFIGMDAGKVATASEEVWEGLHARLHRWAGVLRDEGVASLARVVLSGRLASILGDSSGERVLTDLGHVAQLLHSAASTDQLGTPAVRAWLARRIAESTDGTDETEAEERSRRLESDAEAMQVLTVHRAKGLEFPVVYCPYMWDPGREIQGGQPLLFHDERHDYVRSLDVGESGPDDSNLRAARREQDGEDLRLLYVALTRARHQVVLWWAQSHRCQHSPLGRLLVRREPDGDVAEGGKKPPSDQAIQQHLEQVTAKAPSLVSVERCTPLPGGRWEPDRPALTDLRAAAFARRLDLSWRRTSYTA